MQITSIIVLIKKLRRLYGKVVELVNFDFGTEALNVECFMFICWLDFRFKIESGKLVNPCLASA